MTQVRPAVSWPAQLYCYRFQRVRHQCKRLVLSTVTGRIALLPPVSAFAAVSAAHPRSIPSNQPE